jgi:hypothetical protein
MLSSFWTGIGGKLADRWVAAILSPAFLFWGAGLAAAGQVDYLARRFGERTGTEQAAIVVGAFVLVAVSGFVVEALALPILRLLEGYWPRRFDRVRRALTVRRSSRIESAAIRWRELALAQRARAHTATERDEYARLDRLRSQAPLRAELRMPTRLGNVLRAAEQRPLERYGLDTIVCWSRLWLLLPDTARTELSSARGQIDIRAEVWVWAVLFSCWGVFVWWTPLVGLAVALAVYRSLTDSAVVYGDLVVATYDVYRVDLYRALDWPLPITPADEPAAGLALSRYLARGIAPPAAVFDRREATASKAPATQ